jgi:hypothetical protein
MAALPSSWCKFVLLTEVDDSSSSSTQSEFDPLRKGMLEKAVWLSPAAINLAKVVVLPALRGCRHLLCTVVRRQQLIELPRSLVAGKAAAGVRR